MTSLTAPTVQVIAFATGCALIHAARDRAADVTRWLTGLAVVAAILVLLAASLANPTDDGPDPDSISIFSGA